MTAPDRSHAMDHVVVVLFENRSLDNLLGHLYGPDDGKTFEGVLGRELSNPVPEWAEHQPPDGSGQRRRTRRRRHGRAQPGLRRGVPPHEHAAVRDPRRAQPLRRRRRHHAPVQRSRRGRDADDGRLRHRLHLLLHRRDGTPADVRRVRADHAVLHARAGSGAQRSGPRVRGVRPLVLRGAVADVHEPLVLDRGTCTPLPTGGTTNTPLEHWVHDNTAETIFNRLEAHGRTWKVYVEGDTGASLTGLIHWPRLHDRFATHFVPFSEFEKDAAAGTLPDFAMIEPNLLVGHGDYHPAAGARWSRALDLRRRRAVVDPVRRGVPAAALRRLPRHALARRRQRVEHHAAHRLGRARWHLRPRAARPGPAHPTRPRRQASAASGSTGPATACRPSSSRRGWSRARSTTTSTGTRR